APRNPTLSLHFALPIGIVTCRAGPPMFMRVMTRASLGGAVVGKNPPQSLREADRGSVSDRLLGEQDVGEGVLDVALARRPMHGSQGRPVQHSYRIDELEH